MMPEVPPRSAVPPDPMNDRIARNRERGLAIALEPNLVSWGGEEYGA